MWQHGAAFATGDSSMPSDSKPPATGRNTITAYLCMTDAHAALDFYKKAFGATQSLDPFVMPGGKIGHAELEIGNSKIMLSDEFPEMEVKSANSFGGSPIKLMLSVSDVDAFVERAVGAGAEIVRPVENQFHGERSGQIKDPFGYVWGVGTQVEEVSPEEMHRRAKELFG